MGLRQTICRRIPWPQQRLLRGAASAPPQTPCGGCAYCRCAQSRSRSPAYTLFCLHRRQNRPPTFACPLSSTHVQARPVACRRTQRAPLQRHAAARRRRRAQQKSTAARTPPAQASDVRRSLAAPGRQPPTRGWQLTALSPLRRSLSSSSSWRPPHRLRGSSTSPRASRCLASPRGGACSRQSLRCPWQRQATPSPRRRRRRLAAQQWQLPRLLAASRLLARRLCRSVTRAQPASWKKWNRR